MLDAVGAKLFYNNLRSQVVVVPYIYILDDFILGHGNETWLIYRPVEGSDVHEQ
jgi:hypothetical protein